MTDDTPWSDTGYVVEVPYTREFFRYQTPLSMSFAALCNGVGAPDPTGSFDYLDIGCGEAITLMILAACHPESRFVGIDMNRAHIESASQIARAAGLDNLELEVATFDDFAARTTRSFDYIAAHGIYTWVNEDGRRGVRDIVAKTLKPSGLFYLCHYVRPGADRTKALYDMIQSSMMDHEDLPIVERIRATISDLRKLQEANAPIFRIYPDLDDDLADLETRDDRYLAHEFGNKYFEPLTFANVVDGLTKNGFVFAGSVRTDRNRPENRIGEQALQNLKSLDRTKLEVRMSYLSDESFRWDVFARRNAPRPGHPALRNSAGHLGFGPAGASRKMPPSERHGQRDIEFKTPPIRSMLEAAINGTETLGSLIDTYPDGPEVAISCLRDIVATRVFEPQLRRCIRIAPDSQTTYRHTHSLSALLFDRDFKYEGVSILPAPVRGTALHLYGVQAVITRFLDGCKPGDALNSAWEWISELSPAHASKLHNPSMKDRKQFDREAVIFLRRTMPMLISWNVIFAYSG